MGHVVSVKCLERTSTTHAPDNGKFDAARIAARVATP